MVNLQQLGNEVLYQIKNATWFPYKSGNLKFHATRGMLVDANCYEIVFDSSVAPYIDFLEYGTSGRFNGKFHPGSTKHKGFISQKSVGLAVSYIQARVNGVIVESD